MLAAISACNIHGWTPTTEFIEGTTRSPLRCLVLLTLELHWFWYPRLCSSQHESSGVRQLLILLAQHEELLVQETLCDTVLELFSEQDNLLVEALDTLLCIYAQCKKYSSFGETPVSLPSSALRALYTLSPYKLFAGFARSVSYDHTVLLDLLTSAETEFLHYFVQLLRLICEDWNVFTEHLQEQLEPVMGTLDALRAEITQMMRNNSFPYNATALVKRIEAVMRLHEGTT